mgnify:FL=1
MFFIKIRMGLSSGLIIINYKIIPLHIVLRSGESKHVHQPKAHFHKLVQMFLCICFQCATLCYYFTYTVTTYIVLNQKRPYESGIQVLVQSLVHVLIALCFVEPHVNVTTSSVKAYKGDAISTRLTNLL